MYQVIDAGGLEPLDRQTMSDRFPEVSGSLGIFSSISSGSTVCVFTRISVQVVVMVMEVVQQGRHVRGVGEKKKEKKKKKKKPTNKNE